MTVFEYVCACTIEALVKKSNQNIDFMHYAKT